jgi:ATP-dependent helicase Lhr and Lhr-like helicase
VIAQLDGLELPARAWERDVLPLRVTGYEPALLDMLCLTGAVSWARMSSGPAQIVGATPIALFLREHLDAWAALRAEGAVDAPPLSDLAQLILAQLRSRGATFFHDLAAACDSDADTLRRALGELVAAGAISSDGFAGLRTIAGSPSATARPHRPDAAGRWFVTALARDNQAGPGFPDDGERPGPAWFSAARDMFAWTLLRRYGVVFRRLLYRETTSVPWRDLVRVYRRLEARGEIRGGRFVNGMSGEQFALPEAVERLRDVRRSAADERLTVIGGADPLNLTGVITSGERLRTSTATRIVYRNGTPVGAMEGDMLRMLAPLEPGDAANVAAAAAGRHVPVTSGYVGRVGR